MQVSLTHWGILRMKHFKLNWNYFLFLFQILRMYVTLFNFIKCQLDNDAISPDRGLRKYFWFFSDLIVKVSHNSYMYISGVLRVKTNCVTQHSSQLSDILECWWLSRSRSVAISAGDSGDTVGLQTTSASLGKCLRQLWVVTADLLQFVQ